MTNTVPGMFGSGGSSGADGSNPSGPLGSGMLSGLTSSKALGAAQAGSSAIAMMGDMAAGKQQTTQYNLAAGDAALEGSGALVSGAGQVAGLRTNLMQTLGQRQAAAGAAGVDIGQGTVANTRTALTSRADTASGLDLTGADIMNRKYQINSLNDKLDAQYAGANAAMGALGQGLSMGVGLLKSGIGSAIGL